MLFRRIDDFLASWQHESKSTLQMLAALTPESLDQRVTPEGRSLGRLAWHLTTSLYEALRQLGFDEGGPLDASPYPELAEIVRLYRAATEQVAERVRRRWTDSMLAEPVTLYGQSWPRGQVLLSLVTHQAHHRGQMTVLMRQAGLLVPGVYGPAREEWAAMGVAAHS
jgi:uncharacterized damage-inducible protein DinB